jgi:hypothetical protein
VGDDTSHMAGRLQSRHRSDDNSDHVQEIAWHSYSERGDTHNGRTQGAVSRLAVDSYRNAKALHSGRDFLDFADSVKHR